MMLSLQTTFPQQAGLLGTEGDPASEVEDHRLHCCSSHQLGSNEHGGKELLRSKLTRSLAGFDPQSKGQWQHRNSNALLKGGQRRKVMNVVLEG